MKEHDPAIHSKLKLGAVRSTPILPMMPIGAQVNLYGAVHYKMDAEGHYLNGRIPPFPPTELKAILKAIGAQPAEDSYSGTGTSYKSLTIQPVDGHADRFEVWAGERRIGYGVIDPSAAILSTDEPLSSQFGVDDTDTIEP